MYFKSLLVPLFHKIINYLEVCLFLIVVFIVFIRYTFLFHFYDNFDNFSFVDCRIKSFLTLYISIYTLCHLLTKAGRKNFQQQNSSEIKNTESILKKALITTIQTHHETRTIIKEISPCCEWLMVSGSQEVNETL